MKRIINLMALWDASLCLWTFYFFSLLILTLAHQVSQDFPKPSTWQMINEFDRYTQASPTLRIIRQFITIKARFGVRVITNRCKSKRWRCFDQKRKDKKGERRKWKQNIAEGGVWVEKVIFIGNLMILRLTMTF